MVLRASRKADSSRPAEKTYSATERERAVLRKLADRSAEAAPSLKVSKRGELSASLTPSHPDEKIGCALLMEALGTTDYDFLNRYLAQLANAASHGSEPDEGDINFMLAVVKGIGPRDQIEAMLAAQMAAVHMATMTFARRLAHPNTIVQQDSAERAFNKLTRTFAGQMETLKRYRVGGEQKVTVQHVTVSEGGQAIVGNVTQGQAEGAPKQTAASPAILSAQTTAPMPIIEENSKPAAATFARIKAANKR
jgi:hypothetical protein